MGHYEVKKQKFENYQKILKSTVPIVTNSLPNAVFRLFVSNFVAYKLRPTEFDCSTP